MMRFAKRSGIRSREEKGKAISNPIWLAKKNKRYILHKPWKPITHVILCQKEQSTQEADKLKLVYRVLPLSPPHDIVGRCLDELSLPEPFSPIELLDALLGAPAVGPLDLAGCDPSANWTLPLTALGSPLSSLSLSSLPRRFLLWRRSLIRASVMFSRPL